PTASVSAFKSVVVATTRSLSAARTSVVCRPKAMRTNSAMRSAKGNIGISSERMGGMSAHDERRLEEDLVLDPSAPDARQRTATGRVALRVLVAEAETEELGGPERQIRLDGPLMPRRRRVLRVVVLETGRETAQPAGAEWLDLTEEIPADPVERLRLRYIVRADDVDLTHLVQELARHRQERVLPSLGDVLILGLPVEDQVVQAVRL